MTIRKAAEAAGVGVETIRYYERQGLIQQPPRGTGYRQYTDEAVDRVRFIKRAQALGFTLPEIYELLELTQRPGTTPADIRERAEEKLRTVSAKIQGLQAIQSTLQHLTAACKECQTLDRCPILESLLGS